MDPGSILLAAAGVLGTKAVEESTKLAVADLWSTLKSAVKGRRGADSPALQVLHDVEQLPPDPSPPPAVVSRLSALRLADDPKEDALLQKLESLLAQRAPEVIERKRYIFENNTFHGTTFN